VTLASVLAAATTCSMGLWQLRRAAEKEAVATDILKQKNLPTIDNSALLATKNIADLVHRQASLRGQWLAGQTVFLDNRAMDGLAGFYVVTPLKLSPQGPVLVVQRGWVPRDPVERTRLPVIDSPAGTVTVAGLIALPPSRLYEPPGLSGRQTAGSDPIRQNLDLVEVSRASGLPVLAASLQLTAGDGDGMVRHWPAANLGAERNYGYAAQWFAMFALVIGLYFWFQWIAPYARSRSANRS